MLAVILISVFFLLLFGYSSWQSLLILSCFLFHMNLKHIFYSLPIKPSGGFGNSSHNCTNLNRIRDFQMAIFPNGIIILLIQILNSIFISENLLLQLISSQSVKSVSHTPRFLNLGGFQSVFIWGKYLVKDCLSLPGQIAWVLPEFMAKPNFLPNLFGTNTLIKGDCLTLWHHLSIISKLHTLMLFIININPFN